MKNRIMIKSLKRSTIAILLLAIFYIGTLFIQKFTQTQTPQAQVLSARTNLSLFEEPMEGRTPIINAINNAQQSVEVEVYLLSDKQIISALEQAQARGVSVKVMLEQHPFGGSSSNPKTKLMLSQANISVEWTSSAFSLTHEKAIIIDHKELFVLNQNLTTSAFSKNREYDVIDNNPGDVAEAEQIFSADWQRQPFTPTDSH